MIHNQETTPDIYFHVGLPKTATTFLQHKVFPKLEGVHFVRKRLFWDYKKIIQTHGHSKYLFSSEHDWNIEKVLQLISKDYPHAKIIIAFRRHDKWLGSKYRYYIRKSGYKKFNAYFDIENDNGVLKINDLMFMNYIKLIEKYFHAKPLVIFQDELKHDFYGVIDQLADYMGVTYDKDKIRPSIMKKAFNDKQLYYLRTFNNKFRHDPEKYKHNRKLKRIHLLARNYVVHSYAFLVNLIPAALTPSYELIPEDQIEKIKAYFKDDWEKCREYTHDNKVSH